MNGEEVREGKEGPARGQLASVSLPAHAIHSPLVPLAPLAGREGRGGSCPTPVALPQAGSACTRIIGVCRADRGQVGQEAHTGFHVQTCPDHLPAEIRCQGCEGSCLSKHESGPPGPPQEAAGK